eukprot:SAG31_NODE_2673_length_5268_cov_2.551944_3_plen_87_part_00
MLLKQGDASLFDRFDQFNAKYNPLGESVLRSVFLKSSNAVKGRYFAELTKVALRKLERSVSSALTALADTEFVLELRASCPKMHVN